MFGVHRFPANAILKLLTDYDEMLTELSEKSTFTALTTALKETVYPYAKSRAAGVPGSERVLQGFLAILRKWISVERWFCDGRSYADAVDGLRRTHKIAAIADGARVNFDTNNTSTIGKRVSVVAGAEGIALAMPAISEIGGMGSSHSYAEVALRARKLIMQESMPSLEHRRQKVLAASKALTLSKEAKPAREVEELLADHIPMVDVLFSLLKSVGSADTQVGLLELHVRHLYRPYTMRTLERRPDLRLIKFSFMNRPSESVINSSAPVTSMIDLTRMVSSGSLSRLSENTDPSLSDSTSNLFENLNKERISPTAIRTGVEVILDTLDEVTDVANFETVMSQFPQFGGAPVILETAPINVLYFIILNTYVDTGENDQDNIAERCQLALEPYKAHFKKADVRRVSFVFNQDSDDELQHFPALFTFRSPEFVEDSLFRQIDPSLAIHLDLNRVAAKFNIISLGSRHTSTCDVHLYEAKPKRSALAKDKTANRSPRIFARALSFVLEFSSSSFERILVDALNAFDLCQMPTKSDNHLFINLVSDFEKAVMDPVVIEQVVVDLLKRHGDRVSGLGIVEVETRIVCCLSTNTPPIAIRLFASNPTGYVHVMNTYVEAANEIGGDRIFKLISGTKASLASTGDSSYDGLNVNTSYPLTRPFDAQRNAALRATDTLYCYDLPALFEAAVEQQWQDSSNIQGGIRSTTRPLMVMYTTELVVQKIGESPSVPWTMNDYLKGGLELAQVNRGAGANDVGMVAWLVTLKTVEYPNVSIEFDDFR
jgi:acetyl-CoA carboxylase/biotin carboxylase 1